MTNILTVKKLQQSFTQGDQTIEVLKGVDLQLGKSETLAILGQSGSGKSTLLSLLTGLDRPTSGSIVIDNQEITTLSEEALADFRARRIGIIFQQFHLMPHLTALENVSLPLELAGKPEAATKAHAALEQVGLSHRARHYPRQLSGGECQRVAIARAFVTEPALLFADEPSGNLDQASAQSVTDLFLGLVRDLGMTLVLVTHNEDLARQCQHQRRLQNGMFQ